MDKDKMNYAKRHEWISNFVFLDVAGRLRSILLVASHFLCLLDEVWMQEAG